MPEGAGVPEGGATNGGVSDACARPPTPDLDGDAQATIHVQGCVPSADGGGIVPVMDRNAYESLTPMQRNCLRLAHHERKAEQIAHELGIKPFATG